MFRALLSKPTTAGCRILLHPSFSSLCDKTALTIYPSSLPFNRPKNAFYSSTPKANKNVNIYNDGKTFAVNDENNPTEAEIDAIIEEEIAKMEEEEAQKNNPNWKPGYRKRPLVVSYNLEDFDNEVDPTYWMPNFNKRCGALAIKMGMMPVWDDWGERHPCTVLLLDKNVVMKTFTEEKHGYIAVQLGAGERKRKNVTKPVLGHCEKHLPYLHEQDENGHWKNHPPYIIREFRMTHEQYLPKPGTVIHARHFVPGQAVDVSGISKGKGFQGAMKRWNFSGMPATHGTSLSHRALGSTGQCQDPGRVFKGKKMAGRMGGKRKTTQNLRIVKIDRGRNLLYVRGAVPGQCGNFVEIRDAVKRPLFATEKVEDASKFPPLPTFEYEEGVDGSGREGFECMMPLSKIDPFNPEEEAV